MAMKVFILSMCSILSSNIFGMHRMMNRLKAKPTITRLSGSQPTRSTIAKRTLIYAMMGYNEGINHALSEDATLKAFVKDGKSSPSAPGWIWPTQAPNYTPPSILPHNNNNELYFAELINAKFGSEFRQFYAIENQADANSMTKAINPAHPGSFKISGSLRIQALTQNGFQAAFCDKGPYTFVAKKMLDARHFDKRFSYKDPETWIRWFYSNKLWCLIMQARLKEDSGK